METATPFYTSAHNQIGATQSESWQRNSCQRIMRRLFSLLQSLASRDRSTKSPRPWCGETQARCKGTRASLRARLSYQCVSSERPVIPGSLSSYKLAVRCSALALHCLELENKEERHNDEDTDRMCAHIMKSSVPVGTPIALANRRYFASKRK